MLSFSTIGNKDKFTESHILFPFQGVCFLGKTTLVSHTYPLGLLYVYFWFFWTVCFLSFSFRMFNFLKPSYASFFCFSHVQFHFLRMILKRMRNWKRKSETSEWLGFFLFSQKLLINSNKSISTGFHCPPFRRKWLPSIIKHVLYKAH